MKKFKALFITAIFLFVTFYVPQTSVVASAANDRVTLFRHGDYSGESVALPSGNYSCDQFRYVGDNQLSSLRIPSGMMIIVFDNSNFTGDMRTYTNDTSSMPNFNDRTSAVRVGRISDSTVVYEHANYLGKAMRLLPGGYDTWQLKSGVGNKTISSIYVPNGYRANLYEYDCFGSTPFITGENYFIKNFNDRTSSITIVPTMNNASTVKLYTRQGYCGTMASLGVGNYKFDQFLDVGNNRLVSLAIPNDMVVYAYDNDNFTGDMRVYETSAWDMGGVFEHRTSSIRIFKKSDLVTVYEHGDFGGRKVNLIPGSYTLTQIAVVIGNDTISSIRVPSGYRVYLYEHGNFEGRVRVCTGTESFLSDFNDKTSSIIVSTV